MGFPVTRAPRKLVWTDVTDYGSLHDLIFAASERSTCCIFECRGESGFTVLALGDTPAIRIGAHDDALAFLRARLRAVPTSVTTTPFPFHGGLWAAVNYEALLGLRDARKPSLAKTNGWIVDLERYLIANHQSGRLYAAALIRDGEEKTAALSALSAEVIALLNDSPGCQGARSTDHGKPGQPRVGAPPSSGYEESVRQAQRLMTAKGVSEVVVSLQMFIEGIGGRQFGRLYRQMRSARPAPYMAFFASPELRLAVNSTLGCAEIRSRHLRAETDAGTRNVDLQGPATSLAWDISGKERDEHNYALEALHRDMSMIAIPGSVKVLTSAEPRRFGNIAHLFAEMEGTLRRELDAVDAVAQLSPHGAVSGMPKDRAIEIVPLIEGEARGPYGGLAGVFGFDGFASVATIIRSIWQEDEDTARARFGASITQDSDPAQEYRECIAKAEALLSCLTGIG